METPTIPQTVLAVGTLNYLLGCEIACLRECFRRADQQGDMMVNIESIYADLSKYLGEQQIQMEEQYNLNPKEVKKSIRLQMIHQTEMTMEMILFRWL